MTLQRHAGPLANSLAGKIVATEFVLRQQSYCIISASMNATQCKMARAALGWSVAELAGNAGVAARSIARFEDGERVRTETAEALAIALVAGGASFIETEDKLGVLVKAPG